MRGTYDTTDNQEPDHDINCFSNFDRILAGFAINEHILGQELSANAEIENSSDSHRPEESNEGCLRELVDLVDSLMHCENDRQSTKKQNQDPQEYEPIYRDDIVMDERGPRTHSSKPHENGQVEKHIYCGLEGVVQCL